MTLPLFCAVAGAVHCAVCAVCTACGFPRTPIFSHMQYNKHYYCRKYRKYCNCTYIVRKPSQHNMREPPFTISELFKQTAFVFWGTGKTLGSFINVPYNKTCLTEQRVHRRHVSSVFVSLFNYLLTFTLVLSVFDSLYGLKSIYTMNAITATAAITPITFA